MVNIFVYWWNLFLLNYPKIMSKVFIRQSFEFNLHSRMTTKNVGLELLLQYTLQIIIFGFSFIHRFIKNGILEVTIFHRIWTCRHPAVESVVPADSAILILEFIPASVRYLLYKNFCTPAAKLPVYWKFEKSTRIPRLKNSVRKMRQENITPFPVQCFLSFGNIT